MSLRSFKLAMIYGILMIGFSSMFFYVSIYGYGIKSKALMYSTFFIFVSGVFILFSMTFFLLIILIVRNFNRRNIGGLADLVKKGGIDGLLITEIVRHKEK